MRNTRNQLKRQKNASTGIGSATDPPSVASPITALLSQYELLHTVCQHLSSADIIHLGETSKEHWQYIGSKPKLLKQLLGTSCCDGTGIVAQALVFGHWKGNPENATRKCEGKDAKPCADCGAMVCNPCRLHLYYPACGPYSENPATWGVYEGYNKEELDAVWHDSELRLLDMGDMEARYHGKCVEMTKACEIFYRARFVEHCHDCQPLLIDFDDFDSSDTCGCSIFNHFVARWRCIPCVNAEQARSVASLPKPYTTYKHILGGPYYYERRVFCECGNEALEDGIVTCKHCGLAVDYEEFETDREAALGRIHAQLGTLTDGRSEDPILSQLG